MSRSEPELESMPYRHLVELAKANGVYHKKSAKKVALIKRLSSLWCKEEMPMMENIDPNRSIYLTPVEELDETVLSEDDTEVNARRGTFTKKKISVPKKTFGLTPINSPVPPNPLKGLKRSWKETEFQENLNSPNPPIRQNTFTKDKSSVNEVEQQNVPPSAVSVVANNTPTVNSKRQKLSCETPLENEEGNRRETFTKSVKRSLKKSDPERVDIKSSPHPPTRQNTFVKDDIVDKNIDSNDGLEQTVNGTSIEISGDASSTAIELNTRQAETEHQQSLVRQNTFTKDESLIIEMVVPKQNLIETRENCTTPARVTRLSKTRTPESMCKSTNLPSRQNTFTKEETCGSKTEGDVDVSRSTVPRTPAGKALNTSSRISIGGIENTKTPFMVRPSPSTKSKSSVKKIPNFAEIHKKNFAKMESLMENKLRWKERANQLMSPGRISKMTKILKKEYKLDGKNSCIPILNKKLATKERLKKAMATKSLTGVTMVKTPKDKKILSGVRTNKRFELQLKSIEAKKYAM